MPYLDNHVMMTLKLDRWAQEHTLRGYEIERELAATRHRGNLRQQRRVRRVSLGNLKMLWVRVT